MELVLASLADKVERDRLSHLAWDPRLSPEQFLAREERLRAHPFAQDRMSTWLLRSGERTVSSCETFRMDSRLDGSQGSTYGIASVFTEESLRGNGHASRMLELLHQQLSANDPAAHGSILFSDVGEDIYRRLGYEPRPAIDWMFAPSTRAARTEPVVDDDISELLATAERPDDLFLIWPSAAQIDWHLERERAYSDLIGRPRPIACGARAGRSFGLWASDFKNNRLLIVFFHAEGPAAAEELTRAAQYAAHHASLAEVRMWDHPHLEPFEIKGQKVSRQGELPMLRPYAGFNPENWEWITRALWV